jgi:hypothetical protein
MSLTEENSQKCRETKKIRFYKKQYLINYIDYAIKRNLIGQHYRNCYFPAKEISESVAILFAINRHPELHKLKGNRNIAVYCLGDGILPRTSLMFFVLIQD